MNKTITEMESIHVDGDQWNQIYNIDNENYEVWFKMINNNVVIHRDRLLPAIKFPCGLNVWFIDGTPTTLLSIINWNNVEWLISYISNNNIINNLGTTINLGSKNE